MSDIAVAKILNDLQFYKDILPNLGYEIGMGTIASGVVTAGALIQATQNRYNEYKDREALRKEIHEMRQKGIYDNTYKNEVQWFDDYNKWKEGVQKGLQDSIKQEPFKEPTPRTINPSIKPPINPNIIDPLQPTVIKEPSSRSKSPTLEEAKKQRIEDELNKKKQQIQEELDKRKQSTNKEPTISQDKPSIEEVKKEPQPRIEPDIPNMTKPDGSPLIIDDFDEEIKQEIDQVIDLDPEDDFSIESGSEINENDIGVEEAKNEPPQQQEQQDVPPQQPVNQAPNNPPQGDPQPPDQPGEPFRIPDIPLPNYKPLPIIIDRNPPKDRNPQRSPLPKIIDDDKENEDEDDARDLKFDYHEVISGLITQMYALQQEREYLVKRKQREIDKEKNAKEVLSLNILQQLHEHHKHNTNEKHVDLAHEIEDKMVKVLDKSKKLKIKPVDIIVNYQTSQAFNTEITRKLNYQQYIEKSIYG